MVEELSEFNRTAVDGAGGASSGKAKKLGRDPKTRDDTIIYWGGHAKKNIKKGNNFNVQ